MRASVGSEFHRNSPIDAMIDISFRFEMESLFPDKSYNSCCSSYSRSGLSQPVAVPEKYFWLSSDTDYNGICHERPTSAKSGSLPDENKHGGAGICGRQADRKRTSKKLSARMSSARSTGVLSRSGIFYPVNRDDFLWPDLH